MRKSGCIKIHFSPVTVLAIDLVLTLSFVMKSYIFFSHSLSFPLSSKDMVCVSTGRDLE